MPEVAKKLLKRKKEATLINLLALESIRCFPLVSHDKILLNGKKAGFLIM